MNISYPMKGVVDVLIEESTRALGIVFEPFVYVVERCCVTGDYSVGRIQLRSYVPYNYRMEKKPAIPQVFDTERSALNALITTFITPYSLPIRKTFSGRRKGATTLKEEGPIMRERIEQRAAEEGERQLTLWKIEWETPNETR